MKNRNTFIKINSKKVDIIEGHSYKNKEYYIFCNTELYDLNNKLIPLKKIITYYEDNIELANIISKLVEKTEKKVKLAKEKLETTKEMWLSTRDAQKS